MVLAYCCFVWELGDTKKLLYRWAPQDEKYIDVNVTDLSGNIKVTSFDN